ncbi:MAG: glycogen/starch synthase [Bacteroidales bacterium]|nr:glycogen/starch synthase [Candidatus Cacconaster merdequi]
MEEPKRVLFVNSEIFPYLPESDISSIGRYLPQGIQENGKEIRSFMPRYGLINERRNQLHEVIRLSGMNLVINNCDRPLVIKVSSISSARMQVYFIDNEDYFHRKALYRDSEGVFMEDNDERALFFARGVLETVKKLRWKPDIVHCQGWISHFLPALLKNVYRTDPIFADTKVVLSLYNDLSDERFSDELPSKMLRENLGKEDASILTPANGINLAKLAIRYSDGIIFGARDINEEVDSYAKKSGIPCLPYIEAGSEDKSYITEYNNFYDKILN